MYTIKRNKKYRTEYLDLILVIRERKKESKKKLEEERQKEKVRKKEKIHIGIITTFKN